MLNIELWFNFLMINYQIYNRIFIIISPFLKKYFIDFMIKNFSQYEFKS